MFFYSQCTGLTELSCVPCGMLVVNNTSLSVLFAVNHHWTLVRSIAYRESCSRNAQIPIRKLSVKISTISAGYPVLTVAVLTFPIARHLTTGFVILD